MTTPPDQFVSTGPPGNIAIISERRIPTQPVPGLVQDVIAVTYRIRPNPAQVLFVPIERLPDWMFRRDHPDQAIPDAVQKQGDDILRRIIQESRHQTPTRPRTI